EPAGLWILAGVLRRGRSARSGGAAERDEDRLDRGGDFRGDGRLWHDFDLHGGTAPSGDSLRLVAFRRCGVDGVSFDVQYHGAESGAGMGSGAGTGGVSFRFPGERSAGQHDLGIGRGAYRRAAGVDDFGRGDRGDDSAAISDAVAEYGCRFELLESLGEAGDIRASGSGLRAGAGYGSISDRSGEVGGVSTDDVSLSADSAEGRGNALGDFLRCAVGACLSRDVLGEFLGRA